jgi:tRNA(Ser,Leu) C12 N-acetylase TAN1
MTIDKRYKIVDTNAIEVVYFIEVGGWIDEIVHTIHDEKELEKIPEFEKEAEKKEEEMKEQVAKLMNMVKKLRSMGYKVMEDEGD